MTALYYMLPPLAVSTALIAARVFRGNRALWAVALVSAAILSAAGLVLWYNTPEEEFPLMAPIFAGLVVPIMGALICRSFKPSRLVFVVGIPVVSAVLFGVQVLALGIGAYVVGAILPLAWH